MLTKERAQALMTDNNAANARRICFVCTGNTCRSPMAEAVANALAKEQGRKDLRAFSAGLYACDGEPIAQNAVLALEAAGVEAVAGRDYHRHIAHNLTEREAEEYDLLVGMTSGHAMELMMRYPAAAEKITCMPHGISDPYGGDAARYRACLAEITECVRALLAAEDEK